jgi:hypothetical protein
LYATYNRTLHMTKKRFWNIYFLDYFKDIALF